MHRWDGGTVPQGGGEKKCSRLPCVDAVAGLRWSFHRCTLRTASGIAVKHLTTGTQERPLIMSYETTLFAHIAPRLTDRIEDVAVEALGHILSNSEAARSALEETVGLGGAIVGPIDRVQTQVTGEEGARPDLVGFDDKGTKRVLIEAKFWAGLTPNQPNQYLKQLPRGRPAALLFVAPARRIPMLWPKLLACGRKVQIGRKSDDPSDCVPPK